MKNKIIYTIIGLVIIILLVLSARFIFGGPEDDWVCQDGAWTKHGNPSKPAPTTPCGDQNKIESYLYKDLIRIGSPTKDQKISASAPVKISGSARGNWYFEASFPVQVLDSDGTVLGSGTGQAQGEWTTTNYVPFIGEISFTKPKGKTGSIVFKKDNPSGLPANDDSVSIPINFE
jgi:hypothetical protein